VYVRPREESIKDGATIGGKGTVLTESIAKGLAAGDEGRKGGCNSLSLGMGGGLGQQKEERNNCW